MQRFVAIVIVIRGGSVMSVVLYERELHAKRSATGAVTEFWGQVTIDTQFAGINSICCEGDSLVLAANLILERTVCRVICRF
jgi:hypothetical protein